MEPMPPIPAFLAMEEQPFTAWDVDQAVEAGQLSEVHVLAILTGEELPDPEPDEDGEVPDVKPLKWRVEDLDSAEWAGRMWRDADAEVKHVEGLAAEWRMQVTRWEERVLLPKRTRRALFESMLLLYMRRVREETNGKTKSIKLPSVTLSSTGGTTDKVAIVDDDAVVAWAEENLEDEQVALVVKVTKKALVSELRKVAGIKELPAAQVVLACGCRVTVEGAHDVGDIILGHVCPDATEDPADQPVVEVVDELARKFVVDDADRPVPGVAVHPPTVTYKVTAAE